MTTAARPEPAAPGRRGPDVPVGPRERLRAVIAELHGTRREVAALTRKLEELDRERRLKRVALESSIYGQPNPMTSRPFTQDQAKDAAAVHPDYTPLLTTIDAIRYERDLLVAECETRAFQVELEVAELRATGRAG